MPDASLTFTLLGTGSSGGVPRVGNAWGDCDPTDPRNRRRRCALLVERGGAADRSAGDAAGSKTGDASAQRTAVLIDAGADLREQLLSADVRSLDAVLLTHPHADHMFGLDDLRQLALQLGRGIDVHMDAATSETILRSFGYCFAQAPGSSYPPFCHERRIVHPEAVEIDGPGGAIRFEPLLAEHGDIHALGFRVGDVAYLPDVKRVADGPSLERLEGLDVLIVDALRRRAHPSHMHLDETLGFIERFGPRRAVLTNMHSDLDFATLVAELPDGVEPGHDGMRIEVRA